MLVDLAPYQGAPNNGSRCTANLAIQAQQDWHIETDIDTVGPSTIPATLQARHRPLSC